MKRYLHFYYWLAAVFMMICSTTTVSAQIKVTSLSQLKAGSVIKIYPKDSDGTSHYGESSKALACSGNGKYLTSYEKAGSGNSWTLVDAGDGYYYLKNNLSCYWAYQGQSSSEPLTCTTSQSSAVKVKLTWDSVYGGVCFWNRRDGTGLNNLNGYCYKFNWWSSPSNYASDANTTFDVMFDGKEITKNGIKYWVDFSSKTAKVLSDYYYGSVVIPQTVYYNGTNYVVNELGNQCFKYCSSLKSVTLPDGIVSLGNECFYGCEALTSITLPKSVVSVGAYCFSRCKSLTSITLPEGITSLMKSCFEDCSGLTSITLPAKITSLGDRCFSECRKLAEVTLPNSVTSLGNGCFGAVVA